jgi:hypothetical protein
MLPADERSHAPHGRIDRAETIRVPRSPDESLRVGGYELAMMIHEPTVGTEGEDRVVERSASRARLHPFDDSGHEHDVRLTGERA